MGVVARAPKLAGDDVSSRTQILLDLRFQQQSAGSRSTCVAAIIPRASHDEEADRHADHQFDQGKAQLPASKLSRDNFDH
jgi:hypothetical protein